MKLSRRTTILFAIVVFTVLTVWTIATRKRSSTNPDETIRAVPALTELSGYETKEQIGGNVTVTATPQELTPGKPVVFQLIFDTHTVNLDFDVALAAALRDNQGTTYGVPVWNGDPPGGHHRKGTLSFSTSLGQTTGVTLTLTNIAGIKERMFIWKLKESKGD